MMEKDKKQKVTEHETLSFVKDLLPLAENAGAKYDDKVKTWYAIRSKDNNKAIYISRTKRGVSKIHLSGFDIPHQVAQLRAVQKLSEEDARSKKLGKVRGIIDAKSNSKEDVMKAYDRALKLLTSEDIEGYKFAPRSQKEETFNSDEKQEDSQSDHEAAE